jgi:hypothetical protein
MTMDFLFNIPDEELLNLAENIRLREEAKIKVQEDKVIKQEIAYMTREVPVSSICKRN